MNRRRHRLDKRGLERVLTLVGQRYVQLRVRRLRSKTAVPGQLLTTRWGKRLVISVQRQLYLAAPTALGDKSGQHTHRFRLQYHSGQTATYRCRCGADKERPLTPAEKKRHKASWDDVSDVHKVWHGVYKRLIKKFPVLKSGEHLCNWPVSGWDMDQFLEREAKRRPQHVLSAHTEDAVFMNSAIYFIAHAAPLRMKRSTIDGQPPEPHGGWMGATFIYCPQGGQPAIGFLYPNNVDAMLTALRKLKKLERKYGGGRR